MAKTSTAEMTNDLVQLLGSDLLCVLTRPQRWLPESDAGENGLIIIVWDTALPRCQQAFRRHLTARSHEQRPTDMIGYSQLEEGVEQGLPAALFSVAGATVYYDPKDVIPRLRNLADDTAPINKGQLDLILRHKTQGHFRNIIPTLQRLFAEMYLGSEAALQYKWLASRSQVTRRDCLALASWDGLRLLLDLSQKDPDLEQLLQAIIDSAAALGDGKTVPRFGNDVIQASQRLRKMLQEETNSL